MFLAPPPPQQIQVWALLALLAQELGVGVCPNVHEFKISQKLQMLPSDPIPYSKIFLQEGDTGRPRLWLRLMVGPGLLKMDGGLSFSANPSAPSLGAGVRERMTVPDIFRALPNAISSSVVSVLTLCPVFNPPRFGVHVGKEQK